MGLHPIPRPPRGLLLLALLVALLLAGAPRASAAVHTSPAGVQLITSFEGYVPTVYDDGTGTLTQCYGATGAELRLLPARATQAQCVAQLRRSLDHTYEPPARRLFGPVGALRGLFDQHRFDALVSFDYNLGTGSIACSPGFGAMCRAIESRSMRAIAAAMLLYSNPGNASIHAGLLRRRRAEAALLLRPMGRFELWPADEVALIRGLERLRGHTSAAADRARAALRARIAGRVARLRRVIHATGDPLSHRRGDRLAALRRRIA